MIFDSGIFMAQLVVRNLDEDLVQALKKRAAAQGSSAEEAHRQILQAALRRPKRRRFVDVLAAMPNVGDDADFARDQVDRRG
jgi:plasmid stability protein